MRIAILGAGESGLGAAILAKQLKYEICVSDGGTIKEKFRSELIQYQIPFEEKGHTLDRLNQTDYIVRSPGIPATADVIVALKKSGRKIISEIEFAARHCPGKIIAVTGSNGKTTTTMLCHHLLRSAGLDAALCGNIGKSFARQVAEDGKQWYVVEVSSFQLEDIELFRPDIGILLNITPDHLDRYGGSFDVYAAAKMQLARNMLPPDTLLYNAADPVIAEWLRKVPVRATLVGMRAEDSNAFELTVAMAGRHNALNAACAISTARRAGVGDEDIQKGLLSFKKPGHRMEIVADVRGVRWINDSKATNTNSVYYALEATTAPVIWIAGGQDKGNDYASLMPLVREKVKALICLGIDNGNLIKAFSSEVDKIEETTHMPEAVKLAAALASEGDTVLLSPACASFDLFDNYEDRGRQFKQAVAKLTTE